MREATIEQYLTAAVAGRGGIAIKLAPASAAGLPDRLVLLPGGRIGFLELKKPGKRPTPLQRWWLDRLTGLGFLATWADSRVAVDEFSAKLSS